MKFIALAFCCLLSTTARAESVEPVTFYDHIAPILNKQCQACHQPGAIAGFIPLLSYAQVKPLAERIRAVTASRKMPPFMPDNSGSCATYQNAKVLTDTELANIAAWAQQGTPQGEYREFQPPLNPDTLPEQTHSTSMPEPYKPDRAKHDDYRCFVLDPGLSGTQPMFLTDYLVTPGDAKLVHHVVGYQVTSSKAAQQALSNDAAEAGPGYSCFGGANVSGVRMVINWAPGTGIVSLPKGTGLRLDPGLPLIFQVHYHVVGEPGFDKSSIKMKLVESVPQELTTSFLAPLKILNIPPHQAVHVHEGKGFLQAGLKSNQALKVLGIRAHMHKLGSQMRVSVTTKAGEKCLIDIPHYDYHWQTSFFLSQPVDIMSRDSINIRCVYDSSSQDKRVGWGEGSDDEMCLATLYTTVQ